MRSAELEARHNAAAVVSKLMLICCRAFPQGYNRENKNFAALMPELLVAMVIRVNDGKRGPPLSANRISKRIGMPRANVRRWLDQLVKQGIITKSDGGYVGNDDYLRARQDALYFKRIVRAIRAAAKALDSYD